MRILITGGSGFIGKTLVEALLNDYEVFSPTHKQLELLNTDSVNRYIKRNKIEAIIHCAIKGGPNTLLETVSVFSNLIQNLDKIDKLIYFGTGAEYYKYRNLAKVREEKIGKIIPVDEFGLAKFICNNLSKSYKNVVNLRLFGVYGNNENYLQAFISNAIAKNLFGLPIKINQNVLFDYLFAPDLIPIIKYFLKHDAKYPDYNITPNKSITLKEIAKKINQISDIPSKIDILHTGMNFKYTGNNYRLLSEIKKLEFTSYDVGIRKVYEYRKKNIVKLDKRAIIQDHYLARLKINGTSKKLSK